MGHDGCGGGTAKHNLGWRDSHLELHWLGNGFVIHIPKETMALAVGAAAVGEDARSKGSVEGNDSSCLD